MVTAVQIPFQRSGLTHPLVEQYLSENPDLMRFQAYAPNFEGIQKAIENRRFGKGNRIVLRQVLERQYKDSQIEFSPDNPVYKNILSLKNENTYTITAGQQIHIFLGPQFVAHKLLSAVSLAKECNERFPGKKFVPVFWMATEDHDFEEINYLELFGEKFTWNMASTGPVGRLTTEALVSLADQIKPKFQNDPETAAILDLMRQAYSEGLLFAQATRKIIHQLFGHLGIVVLDPDDASLKETFVPVMLNEVNSDHTAIIENTTNDLEKAGFKRQANARETNLFLLPDDSRVRIEKKESGFATADKAFSWTKKELVELIEKEPGLFSPNVLLRPLYQETVLPNIAYITGASEMIYWFQLKDLFVANGIQYPVVWLRSSALLVPSKIKDQLTGEGISEELMLLPEKELKDMLHTRMLDNAAAPYLLINRMEGDLVELEKHVRSKDFFSHQLLDNFKQAEHKFKDLKSAFDEAKNQVLLASPSINRTLKTRERYYNPKQERINSFLEFSKHSSVLSNEHNLPYWYDFHNFTIFYYY
jgi:bacillithiol biosynthesis cysteine-adding enzyme BshC